MMPSQDDNHTHKQQHNILTHYNTHHKFYTILLFLLALVSIRFDTQILATFLPMHATIGHSEEIFGTEGVSGWDLNETHPGWSVPILTCPVGQDVVCGTPREVSVVVVGIG